MKKKQAVQTSIDKYDTFFPNKYLLERMKEAFVKKSFVAKRASV